MHNHLDEFAKGIEAADERGEKERTELNKQRGEPHLFVADSDPELAVKGFGVGYWVVPEHKMVVAIRKFANGYEKYACGQYEADWLREMVKLCEEKGV